MIKEAIIKLSKKQDLAYAEAYLPCCMRAAASAFADPTAVRRAGESSAAMTVLTSKSMHRGTSANLQQSRNGWNGLRIIAGSTYRCLPENVPDSLKLPSLLLVTL